MKIENQYKGKTAEQVWDMWTESQIRHFLDDHSEQLDSYAGGEGKIFLPMELEDCSYEELPDYVKKILASHIDEGQYKKGGEIKVADLKVGNKYDWELEKGAILTYEGKATGSGYMFRDENGAPIHFSKKELENLTEKSPSDKSASPEKDDKIKGSDVATVGILGLLAGIFLGTKF